MLFCIVPGYAWANATTAEPAAPAQSASASASGTNAMQAPARALPEFYIREYRVLGAHHLQPVEIENAVYPFLGPGRTAQDVEHARAALLKAYEDKQITSVDVVVPPQNGAGGIVFLQVNELTIGRLRVHGSRFYDINEIKAHAPSLAEGQLVNFTNAQNDIVNLNQLPDRKITPVIRPGVLANTMDVDLNVKDTAPLHGSVELNNRYSLDTPDLRTDASLSYDNLWQLGHSIGASVETSPQDTNKVAVFTGFYTLRFPDAQGFTLTLQGTKQDSFVSTLGDVDSVGNGFIIGLRANFKLPTMSDYYQSLTFGIDYKALNQSLFASPDTPIAFVPLYPYSPTRYMPLSLDYSGTWVEKNSLTDLDLAVVFGIRGIGSSIYYDDLTRFDADSNFIYLHGFLSRTQDLPDGFQVFGRVLGQISDSPLLTSEEFSAGGVDTVRGYLESEVLGDNAALVNFEFRSPSLLTWFPSLNKSGDKTNEWRFYFFTDAATIGIDDALPGQPVRASLASYGGGTHMTIFNHFNGSLDLAVPLFNQNPTKAQHPFLTFRVWSDF